MEASEQKLPKEIKQMLFDIDAAEAELANEIKLKKEADERAEKVRYALNGARLRFLDAYRSFLGISPWTPKVVMYGTKAFMLNLGGSNDDCVQPVSLQKG